jgi:predicted porin
MKKALIGTSALIAVGLLTAQGASASEKIKLGLSGNYRVLGGIVNQDDGLTNDAANTRNHGLGTDGKVNFSGTTTLDSGIEVGFRAELELQLSGSADTIDEHYMWIENTDVWGRIEMGDRDGAGNKMNTLAPFVFGAAIVGVQTIQLANSPANSAAFVVAVPGMSGDATKVTYFTPKFSGVQIGISYTPESSENIGGAFGTSIANLDNTALDIGEILEIGANWNGSMGDAAVSASAAYASGSGEKATAAAVNDHDRWAVGAKVSQGGWALGAQYINNETNPGAVTNAANTQRDDITTRVGLTYASGAWVYGAEYANRAVEVTATGEDEATVWGVGAKRTLGAGVTAGIGVHVWDWQDDLSAVAGENDATEFFFITEISF